MGATQYTAAQLDEMLVNKQISCAIYRLNSCYVQIHSDGNEDYLAYGSNVWGAAKLNPKDIEIYESGLDEAELDVDMTLKYCEFKEA